MQPNTPMLEEDSSALGWVVIRVASMNTTFIVLIQQELLDSPTFQTALGNMLSGSNLERLESGVLNISQLLKVGETLDLNHFFVVQKTVLSAFLLKFRGGTGRQKPGLCLIAYKAAGSLDQAMKISLLPLLQVYMTSAEFSRTRKSLLKGP